ncbi:hypothetical protein [Gemmata sp.]|uniref:hypothetical protein n=1 Tax=Gemmata sp. TaxID=1914242 RepID=UPI003F707C56
MSTVIKPTVGRVVLFYPADRLVQDQPLAAVVAAVWGDRCVNLGVFHRNGVPMSHPPTSVTLVQPGDVPPSVGAYCTWMPYQIDKAAKQQAEARNDLHTEAMASI